MLQNRNVPTVALLLVLVSALTPGCIFPDLGSSLKATPGELAFGTEHELLNIVVNLNPSSTPLVNPVTAISNKPWIIPLDCTRMGDECYLDGPLDSIVVPVRIDRSLLTLGENKGTVTLRTNTASDLVVDVTAEDTLETNFHVNNQVPEVGESVSFTDTTRTTATSGPVIDRVWEFGDGTTSNAKNPVHAFLNPGFYKVTLKVTTTNDQETRIRPAYIVVGGTQIGVNFTASATTVFENDAVTFTDISNVSAPVTGRLWDFGVTDLDGSDQSTEISPVFRYPQSGIYTVSLTLNTGAGNVTAVKNEYIIVQSRVAPRADFRIQGGDTFNAGVAIQFFDQSEPGTAPIQWLWDFGDGTTSEVQNPTHTYTTGGVKNVSLTAVSDHGANTATKQVTIVVTPPAAAFDIPTGPFIDVATTFQNNSTLGTGQLVGYQWNFGDGSTSTAANPTHTYVNRGAFSVSLTVTTSHGSSTARREVTVTYQPPTAVITSPNGGVPGQPIAFNSASSTSGSAAIDTWLWDFGDGATSALQNTVHTYATPGIYTVSLTVSSPLDGNNSDTATKQISIVNPPIPAFDIDSLSAVTTLPVQLTNRTVPGTEPQITYLWEFGDGGTSNQVNPAHQYNAPGTYTITLTASSASSGPQVASRRITVDQPPTPDFTGTPTQTLTDTPVQFTDDSDDEGVRPITGRLWNFGNGSVSANINPAHSYAAAGTYTVSLTLTFAHSATGQTLSVARTRNDYITVVERDMIVNTGNDTLDADVSSVLTLNSNPGQDGRVSLREAITAANNTVGPDVINFQGNLNITVQNGPLPAVNDISGGVTITGNNTRITAGPALANAGIGLTINSANNRVTGLQISNFVDGGIDIAGFAARDNLIGTLAAGAIGNIISANGKYGNFGVRVSGLAAVRNQIRANQITNNTGAGILLSGGANQSIAAPVITGVEPFRGTTAPNATVEVFIDAEDEGALLLETIVADENGDFRGAVSLTEFYGGQDPEDTTQFPRNINATTTGPAGNTSMFSVPFPVPAELPEFQEAPAPPVVN